MNNEISRDKTIIRTSIIGILANIFLASFKAFVGLVSNSIAIVLDAVNNLSDALSSLITIVGTKLAGREPDKKHPYGYGRIEYITATIIAVIVLYAGVTSFIESVKKIIAPETPDYTTVSLIIVAVGVVVKILLGRYVKSVGEKVNSDSLVNSGEDATLDSIISASTLVAALIYLFFHVSLEAYLGAVISIVIIRSGIEMLNGTLSNILGERVDSDLAKRIKAIVCSVNPDIKGAYDLVLHDYGPDRLIGSIHVEIPDYYSADQLDELTRKIQYEVRMKEHVILTTVGFYAQNTKNDSAKAIYNMVREIVEDQEHVMQMHGFYVSEEEKYMRFDVVVDFKAPDRKAVHEEVIRLVQEEYPDYQLDIALDVDTSD